MNWRWLLSLRHHWDGWLGTAGGLTLVGGIAGKGALMWRHLVTRGAYITAVRPRDGGIEERDMEWGREQLVHHYILLRQQDRTGGTRRTLDLWRHEPVHNGWQINLFVLQHAQWSLNRIEKTFNGTFAGWKNMHQGFRIYFVRNPRLKAIEMAS